jgi:excisionase family DNA binding protein
MMNKTTARPPELLLTVDAAAERMSTSVRFVRRLIAERRIGFVKIGRYVRISEAALADFIEAGRVEPMTVVDVWARVRGVV